MVKATGSVACRASCSRLLSRSCREALIDERYIMPGHLADGALGFRSTYSEQTSSDEG